MRCCWGVHILLLAWLVHATDGVARFTPHKMQYYRERVKSMFYHAYHGYLEHAFPFDELKPISCSKMDTWGSFSLTLVDALDTLLIMGNVSEFKRASELVLESIDFNANVNVSVFETNIRVIGGLISAHMLSGVAGASVEDGWPCAGPLLRLAERLANKLLPAFNSWSGMPYGTVNLRYGVHRLETPVTCTAGIGTFLLEFGALSRLTGNPHYERVAMKAVQELWKTTSAIGLVGNHLNVQNAQWTATDAGIGAGVDSYFEYLAKGAILFNRPDLMRIFNEYKSAIEKYIQHDDWFLWVSMTKGHVTIPVFQSLEQFWPGLLTLTGDTDSATRILLNYHQVLRQYGFSPEFFNVPNLEAVHRRSGYPLRPELVESLFYTYQATRDPLLLQMGVDILEAIEHSAKTKCGYATVHNVKDHTLEDRMESFFLSETSKYLYLLFDPDSFIHNPGAHGRVVETTNGQCVIETGGYVFNTEAHPIDPSILYCCDARRTKDVQIIQNFENNLDLVMLLGLDAGVSPEGVDGGGGGRLDDLDFLTQDLPSVILMDGDLAMTYSSSNQSQPQEVQFEIDPVIAARIKQRQNDQTQTLKGPPSNTSSDYGAKESGGRKLLSLESDSTPSPLPGPVPVQPEPPRKDEDRDNFFAALNLLLRGEADPSKLDSWVKASVDDSVQDVTALTQLLQELSADNCEEEEETSSSCRKGGFCRIVDRDTGSAALNALLRAVHGLKQNGLASGQRMCLAADAPKESDNYNSTGPDRQRLQMEIDLQNAIDNSTLKTIDLLRFNTKELQIYQYGIMSCRTQAFDTRLFQMGEVRGES